MFKKIVTMIPINDTCVDWKHFTLEEQEAVAHDLWFAVILLLRQQREK